jgi:hypothetical protein
MALKIETRRAWGFSRKAAGGAQLALRPSEVHRLNPVPPGIRVLSGTAWITWKGDDIVLQPGQTIRFSRNGNNPVISAVGQETLIVEMLEA